MKFAVNTTISNSNIRIGRLSEFSRIPNAVFLTPLLLLYTRGGSVTHLTREVLEMVAKLSSQVIQIPLANSAQCYSGMKHFKGEISKFVGLDECISYCSVQDPSEETKEGYNDKNSVTIWTRTGRKQLTPDKYMDLVEAFRPDMYHVLCDGDTNKGSTHKRAHKAVDVTTKMFITCLERHNTSEHLTQSALLAVLEGGYDLEARRESAQMFASHPQVEGFVIDGLHNNGGKVEEMTYEMIRPVIEETLKHLPESKLRVVHGAWRPDVVLELVRAGVDVFDSSLVYLATERGCAFTFSYTSVPNILSRPQRRHSFPPLETIQHLKKPSTNYEININDKKYFDDFSPIRSGCKCLTCTKHTRAYIHHLLNTKEMLASVLLMIHNLHHYQEFFQAIRESAQNGQFLTIDPPIS